MPNSPKTPTRTIRVSDDIWSKVKRKALSEDRTVTSVVLACFEDYIKVDTLTE